MAPPDDDARYARDAIIGLLRAHHITPPTEAEAAAPEAFEEYLAAAALATWQARRDHAAWDRADVDDACADTTGTGMAAILDEVLAAHQAHLHSDPGHDDPTR